MKFQPYQRAEGFVWTDRKLAFAQSRATRQAEKERARYPLLADQIPEPPPFDFRAETHRRDAAGRRAEKRQRDLQARIWREARRDARMASRDEQAAIQKMWASWSGPLTSLYYRYVVDFCTGVMEQRSQRHKEREAHLRTQRIERERAQQSLELCAE